MRETSTDHGPGQASLETLIFPLEFKIKFGGFE